MTAPDPPLPHRDETEPMPPSWGLCPRCGVAAPDRVLHQKWHDAIETRMWRALDLSRPVPALEERIDKLENTSGGA